MGRTQTEIVGFGMYDILYDKWVWVKARRRLTFRPPEPALLVRANDLEHAVDATGKGENAERNLAHTAV